MHTVYGYARRIKPEVIKAERPTLLEWKRQTDNLAVFAPQELALCDALQIKPVPYAAKVFDTLVKVTNRVRVKSEWRESTLPWTHGSVVRGDKNEKLFILQQYAGRFYAWEDHLYVKALEPIFTNCLMPQTKEKPPRLAWFVEVDGEKVDVGQSLGAKTIALAMGENSRIRTGTIARCKNRGLCQNPLHFGSKEVRESSTRFVKISQVA